MDVSERGEVVVQEEEGWPLKIDVLVSKSLGEGELGVGLKDLKRTSYSTQRIPQNPT